jgi:hypothetical protein
MSMIRCAGRKSWLGEATAEINQAGPRLEPSHVFHFKGRIARSADFVGSGVDGSGERLSAECGPELGLICD